MNQSDDWQDAYASETPGVDNANGWLLMVLVGEMLEAGVVARHGDDLEGLKSIRLDRDTQFLIRSLEDAAAVATAATMPDGH